MNGCKLIISGLALFSILSCAKKKEGEMSLTLVGTTSYLINADAQSCVNIVEISKDPAAERFFEVPGWYFSYQGLTMSWKNTTDTAYIQTMDFNFSSEEYSQKCTVPSDEMVALFYDFEATGTKDWDGTLAPATSAAVPMTRSTGSLCRIRCGGNMPPAGDKPITVTGKIIVRGFQRSPSGEDKPFKAESPVKLIYEP